MADRVDEAEEVLPRFRVAELKAVLKTLRLSHTANKSVLLERIRQQLDSPNDHTRAQAAQAVLQEAARRGFVDASSADFAGFNFPSLSSASGATAASRASSSTARMPASSAQSFGARAPSGQTDPRYSGSSQASQRRMISCPFLKSQNVVMPLVHMDLGMYGDGWNVSRQFAFAFNSVQRQLLRTGEVHGKPFRVFLRCGVVPKTAGSPQICKDMYPKNGSFKVNHKALPVTAGVCHPVDITDWCRKPDGSFHERNQIEAIRTSTNELTFHQSVLEVVVATRWSVEDLIRSIRHQSFDAGKAFALRKLQPTGDDDLVVSSNLQIRLQCPMGFVRMELPGKSSKCQHVQCFDLRIFLKMNERRPSWLCPVCHNQLRAEDLHIDDFFSSILFNTPESVTEVVISPDGSWTIDSSTSEPPRKRPKPSSATSASSSSGNSTTGASSAHHQQHPHAPGRIDNAGGDSDSRASTPSPFPEDHPATVTPSSRGGTGVATAHSSSLPALSFQSAAFVHRHGVGGLYAPSLPDPRLPLNMASSYMPLRPSQPNLQLGPPREDYSSAVGAHQPASTVHNTDALFTPGWETDGLANLSQEEVDDLLLASIAETIENSQGVEAAAAASSTEPSASGPLEQVGSMDNPILLD